VIGENADARPTGGDKSVNAMGNIGELLLDAPRELFAFVVPVFVEGPDLSPRAAGGIASSSALR
jgi:hypothetical protein